MNLFLLYYSGAGNTQLVVSYLARELRRMGHRVTTRFARKGAELPDRFEYDGLIVASPVYTYQPPQTLMETVERLPELRSAPVFTLMTKGLISGNAPLTLSRAISEKGGIVVGHAEITMADTLFILTSKRNSLIEKIMLLPNMMAVREIRKLPQRVLRSFEEKVPVPFRPKIYAKLTDFIARKFHKFVEQKVGQFYADERCDLCGACVGLCPESNIRIVDSRVLWGMDCEFCMRCVHRCPQEAIQIGRYIREAGRYVPPKDAYLRALLK